ncbi:integrator complex subunit 7 homolog isoform X2 [Cotesia glomerata]|uniref:integrator complex subunit 7 homolog isoform X2 n=1 Tax=Cotesia glomerata TaxID=32391 RepID=UPI001D024CED|nr:integrator complex subunit 7 homolog isoform X2 [Cotesia glomerata]
MAYKLTPHHLKPEGYQKMNVPLAIELFSESISNAMKLLKDEPDCIELHDCDSTIIFIEKVNKLIKAMLSRTPIDALRPADDNVSKKAIIEFDTFIRNWETTAKEKIEQLKQRKKNGDSVDLEKMKSFYLSITASTLTGLKISLGSTLELIDFLHSKCNYDYLMTSRLTQDMLEKFFGIARSACGSNDHPDPILFSQVFRLLCSYSLATPPKGSNVTAGELLGSLMQTRESFEASNVNKENWSKKIDAIIENASGNPSSAEANTDDDRTGSNNASDNNNNDNNNNNNNDDDNNDNDYDNYDNTRRDHEGDDNNNKVPLNSVDSRYEHDYDIAQTSNYVISYIAGYVARKIGRFSKCFDCTESMQSRVVTARDKFIELMDKGALIYPSEQLFNLIKSLEEVVLMVVGTKTVNVDTMFEILDDVSKRNISIFVGCDEHKKELTKKIINNFLIMRGHFLVKCFNKSATERKVKSKKSRKISKLH